MTKNYQEALESLQQEIQQGGARPAIVDAAIVELSENPGEHLTKDLLLQLSDHAEHDESMFSIIHAAEASNDEDYVRALLEVFADIYRSSPRWTSIVLMRVLNSRSTQLEMVRQLRNASASTKGAVKEMCQRISDVSPEFLSKTVPLVLAAEPS